MYIPTFKPSSEGYKEPSFQQFEIPEEPLPNYEGMLIAANGAVVASGDYDKPLIVETRGIAVGKSGYIRGNQTDYNTGTGFFLGTSGGVTKFSIGNPAGNYLTWDGTTLTISAVQSDYQIFTTSGTWTKPSGLSGNEEIIVRMWGGGGGGGGVANIAKSAGAGGGGAYEEQRFRASDLPSTVTVTIGTAAAGGAAGDNDGTAGTDTTFGTIITAKGGALGRKASVANGGNGGNSALGYGTNVYTGGAGGASSLGTGSPSTFGGGGGGAGSATGGAGSAVGGDSYFGGGGGGSGNVSGAGGLGGAGKTGYGGAGGSGGSTNSNGSAGTAPGGGGGGAASNIGGARAGGDGAIGEVRVWIHR